MLKALPLWLVIRQDVCSHHLYFLYGRVPKQHSKRGTGKEIRGIQIRKEEIKIFSLRGRDQVSRNCKAYTE